jgi:predicted dehydrogenase
MRASDGNTVEERMPPVIDQFAAEMDHFSDCVMRNVEPKTPGEEGLKDLVIMEAIYRSAAGHAPVKL